MVVLRYPARIRIIRIKQDATDRLHGFSTPVLGSEDRRNEADRASADGRSFRNGRGGRTIAEPIVSAPQRSSSGRSRGTGSKSGKSPTVATRPHARDATAT